MEHWTTNTVVSPLLCHIILEGAVGEYGLEPGVDNNWIQQVLERAAAEMDQSSEVALVHAVACICLPAEYVAVVCALSIKYHVCDMDLPVTGCRWTRRTTGVARHLERCHLASLIS